MTYPSLYILRHGQTEWNADDRMQGSLNSPLTALGREQAEAQHAILKDVDLTGYEAIASPQGRAFHTASIALRDLFPRIRTDNQLVEIGLGAWEGKYRKECLHPESQENVFALYEQAPGGEGFTKLHARCLAFLSRLEGPAVLVTHGVTSRMLRLILLGLGTERIADLPGGQGVVYHLEDGVQRKLKIGA